MRSSERPYCPDCDSPLKVIGSRKRMIRQADGDSRTLLIRRLRCGSCGCVHHELPDIVVPYKRYDSETIEEVLTPKDISPPFPCETSTASRLLDAAQKKNEERERVRKTTISFSGIRGGGSDV